MIDINLIPLSLRKNAKDPNAVDINIPKELLLGVGVGLIFLLILIHLFLGAIWLMGMGRLSINNAQWQTVLPDKNRIDAMNKESSDLKTKIKLISDMTVKKSVLWSPKFNAISDALPKGLWLRRMTLDKQGLTMEGSAVSKNQSEINNVGVFLSSLKQNDEFMKDFSTLEVNSIQGSKSNAIDVTDFSVMAKVK